MIRMADKLNMDAKNLFRRSGNSWNKLVTANGWSCTSMESYCNDMLSGVWTDLYHPLMLDIVTNDQLAEEQSKGFKNFSKQLFSRGGITGLFRNSIRWHGVVIERTQAHLGIFQHLKEMDWKPVILGTHNTGNLELVELLSPDEIIKEGAVLSHCVGNYVDKWMDGRCVLASIRTEYGKHLSTVQFSAEDDRFELIQHRGYENCIPGDAEQDLVQSLLSKSSEFVDLSAVYHRKRQTRKIMEMPDQRNKEVENREIAETYRFLFGRQIPCDISVYEWLRGDEMESLRDEIKNLDAHDPEIGDPRDELNRFHFLYQDEFYQVKGGSIQFRLADYYNSQQARDARRSARIIQREFEGLKRYGVPRSCVLSNKDSNLQKLQKLALGIKSIIEVHPEETV